MADKVPVRAVFTSGDTTALSEFQSGESVPIDHGGTAATTAADARSNLGAVGTSDTQTLTNKTIDADNNTISNLAHGAEVDDPSTGVHGVTGDVVGTTDTQTLTNKTIELKQGTGVSPTAEGDIQWDTDDDKLKVGDGSATKTFSDDSYTLDRTNHTGTQTLSTISDSGTAAAKDTGKTIGDVPQYEDDGDGNPEIDAPALITDDLSVRADSGGNVARFVTDKGNFGVVGEWKRIGVVTIGTEYQRGSIYLRCMYPRNNAASGVADFVVDVANDDSGLRATWSKITAISIVGVEDNVLLHNAMKLVTAGGLGDDIEVWMQNNKVITNVWVYEIGRVFSDGSVSISYDTSTSSQSTEPTDTVEMRSDWPGEWITPSFQNGWGTTAGFEYRKLANGMVNVQGQLDAGTTTDGTVAFTLPAGYRPGSIITDSLVGSDVTGGAGGAVNIITDGNVKVQDLDTGASNYYANIWFLAEN